MTRYIEQHRDEFGVEPICRVLEVAPSTLYAARSRPPSARANTSDRRRCVMARRQQAGGSGSSAGDALAWSADSGPARGARVLAPDRAGQAHARTLRWRGRRVVRRSGSRWFRHAGGMPPLSLAEPTGRYLSFHEREELALLKAQGLGVRGDRS